MRVIRVASLALIGTAALALGGPAALADDGSNVTSFGFTVTPTTVAPGGTVTLNATECEVPTVTATSGIFDTVTLNEGLPATAKIAEDAKPDADYDVTFDCKGEKGTTPLTVTGGSDAHTGGKEPTEPPDTLEPPETTGTTEMKKPGGGVKGGNGGSFAELSPTQIGVGSALIAGALAGGGVLLLRRRTGDGT
ncbi:hypothetical protein [Streptomyces sp. NPDC005408]|uniref:hypothetical protein n=1 Tax=Streptomyces sp. NPDC005408 TaxID=3155341 RepID=UPI0033BDDE39